MLYGGCDLGVVSAKAAIIDDNGLLAFEILPYTGYPQEAAAEVMKEVLARAGAHKVTYPVSCPQDSVAKRCRIQRVWCLTLSVFNAL